jgi:hypothetical protein
MLATCNGGETDGAPENPLPDNLSCDAHKNHIAQKKRLANNGALQPNMEGRLINPLDIPAFPNVFTLRRDTGRLAPDKSACDQAGIRESDLSGTIEALNLNCNRLAQARRNIAVAIEKRKKALRDKRHGPEKAVSIMVSQYLGGKFPEYFTTYRCCLGKAAEDYLRKVNYQG